jgi:hypothetical protein
VNLNGNQWISFSESSTINTVHKTRTIPRYKNCKCSKSLSDSLVVLSEMTMRQYRFALDSHHHNWQSLEKDFTTQTNSRYTYPRYFYNSHMLLNKTVTQPYLEPFKVLKHQDYTFGDTRITTHLWQHSTSQPHYYATTRCTSNGSPTANSLIHYRLLLSRSISMQLARAIALHSSRQWCYSYPGITLNNFRIFSNDI